MIAILVILVGTHNLSLYSLKKVPFGVWDFVLMVCITGNAIMKTFRCSPVLTCNIERPRVQPLPQIS